MRCGLLTVSLTLGSAAFLQAAPPTDQVPELIRQLGSNQFVERQSASQALDDIGAPALAVLRQAAQSTDPEVSRRAQELIARIEKRTESSRLLQSRRVRLSYKDTPLTEALADFGKKTGFNLRLDGDKSAWADRKITLDTGEVGLWEAFAQFASAAGLVERSLIPEKGAPKAADSREDESKDVIIKKLMAGDRSPVNEATDLTIPVVLGTAPKLPICVSGALRIRALNHVPPGWGQTPGSTKATCTLEVTPEPGLAWLGIADVQVEKAVDSNDRQLSQFLDGDAARSVPASVIGWQIAAMKSSRQLYVDDGVKDDRVDIHFKLTNQPSKLLKELQGKLIGQMQTPPEPIVTVDDVLKSAGQTVKGKAGGSVRVVELERQKDGQVRMQVELETAPADNIVPARRRMNQVIMWNIGARGDQAGGPQDLALHDARGQAFQAVNQSIDSAQFNGRMVIYSCTVVFKPQPGQGEPAKLVFSGRRTVLIEVPFQLNNVPLP